MGKNSLNHAFRVLGERHLGQLYHNLDKARSPLLERPIAVARILFRAEVRYVVQLSIFGGARCDASVADGMQKVVEVAGESGKGGYAQLKILLELGNLGFSGAQLRFPCSDLVKSSSGGSKRQLNYFTGASKLERGGEIGGIELSLQRRGG